MQFVFMQLQHCAAQVRQLISLPHENVKRVQQAAQCLSSGYWNAEGLCVTQRNILTKLRQVPIWQPES